MGERDEGKGIEGMERAGEEGRGKSGEVKEWKGGKGKRTESREGCGPSFSSWIRQRPSPVDQVAWKAYTQI